MKNAKTVRAVAVLLIAVFSAVAVYSDVDDLIGDDFELEKESKREKVDEKDLKNARATVFLDAEGFEGTVSGARTTQISDSWLLYGRRGCSRDMGLAFVGKDLGITAKRKFAVPEDGKYNVWARYLMKIGSNGCFKVEIHQDGKSVFSKKYYDYIQQNGDVASSLEKERGWVFDDAASKEGVIAGEVMLWESATAELKKGDAEIRLIVEKQKSPPIAPFVDCFVLTRSLTYKPNFKDLTSVWVRFKLYDVEPKDAEFSLDLGFLRRDGHNRELGYWFYNNLLGIYNPEGDEFGVGEYTAWTNMDKFLWRGGGICTVNTKFKSGKEIKKAKCEIQIAWGPSEHRIIKTIVEKGNGTAFGFDMPCEIMPEDRYFKTFRGIAEQIDAHYNFAKGLNLDDKWLPKLLLINSSGHLGWNNYFCDPELLKKELEVVRIIGINALSGGNAFDPKLMRELGFREEYFGGSANPPLFNPYVEESYNCPNKPDIEKRLRDEYEKYYSEATYLRGKVSVFKLGDEIGVRVSENHIESCSYCIKTYKTFLKDYCGLKPEDFGRKSFDKVKFIPERNDAEGKYASLMFYYSRRFMSYNTVYFFTKVAKEIEKTFGKVATYANYSPGILYGEGVGDLDWIELGRLNGTVVGWSEDWGFKPVPYLVDYFRSAGRYKGEPVGMYIIGHSGDHYRKTLSSVAHGCKRIWLYDYQTYFASTGDAFTEETTTVKAFAEASRIIGKADDIFYYGNMERPQVAFLYSRTGEIWRSDGGYNLEMKRLYLALLYKQITVDIITEDDVLKDGELDKYKAVFIFYSHNRKDVAEKLADWVKKGGTIIGCAGCGLRDETNRKNKILTEVFGIDYIKTENRLEKPKTLWLKVLSDTSAFAEKIRITDDKLLFPEEIDCVEYRAHIKTKTAKVLAEFADRSPAVCKNDFGKGTAVYFATLPGGSVWTNLNAYWIPPISKERERKFELLEKLVKYFGVEKSVEVDRFGIEAIRTECETGVAVSLINYYDTRLANVSVKIKYPGEFKTIESAVMGKINFKKTGEWIEVNLPLKEIDIVIIRKN